MTLGVEESQIVLLAYNQSKRVESNLSEPLRVNAPYVNRKLFIDEHPEIIISEEAKHLPLPVDELRVEPSTRPLPRPGDA